MLKKAEKHFGTSTGFEPVTSQSCSNPVEVLNFFQSSSMQLIMMTMTTIIIMDLALAFPIHCFHFQSAVELEFGVLLFVDGGNWRTQRKTLGARTRTNNKLNPHVTPGLGIEPGPHRWEVSALTTVQSLLPRFNSNLCMSLHR